jgi:hypothetical protein
MKVDSVYHKIGQKLNYAIDLLDNKIEKTADSVNIKIDSLMKRLIKRLEITGLPSEPANKYSY